MQELAWFANRSSGPAARPKFNEKISVAVSDGDLLVYLGCLCVWVHISSESLRVSVPTVALPIRARTFAGALL